MDFVSEAIEKVRLNNVFMKKGPRKPQFGSLALVGHHMIFSPHTDLTKQGAYVDELWLLDRAIDRVSVEPINKEDPSKGSTLILKCKNFMICTFEIVDNEDCMAIARSISRLSNLCSIQHEYPFFYRCPFTVLDDGWTAFDTEQDFARLVIHRKDGWRISSVNTGFTICPSYPEKVIVPKGIGDDYLRISATFRDGARFPIFSYFHRETKSCIMRCGQPLIGPANRRCKEDEAILNSVLSVSKGIIVDTRTKQQSQGAKNKGGGCESQMFYSQWKYVNSPIARLKETNDALTKLIEICNESSTSSDKWFSKVGACGWLQIVADTLNSVITVAQFVHNEGSSETPVVIHGGEGTDSTLLVTSLAQLVLDSDTRTIRGFESLVEREWINAGHPFAIRCAHSVYSNSQNSRVQESPVFLLFLDCVWQIYRQYQCSFEFTEEFLIFLFEHAYASEFGSFLGNNEREKSILQIKKRTVSLWSYVNNPEILRKFVNVLYEPNDLVLWPCVAPQSIVVWERMYFRWLRDWKQLDDVKETVMAWKMREKELQSKVLLMRRQLLDIMKSSVEA